MGKKRGFVEVKSWIFGQVIEIQRVAGLSGWQMGAGMDGDNGF